MHGRLVQIRRQLVALTAKDKLKQTEFKPLLEELRKIDSLSCSTIYHVRKFQLNGLLLCHVKSRDSTSGTLGEFTPLPRPSLCCGCPLSVPLCLPYSKRVDGKFLGPNGTIPASQAVCSSLLEECFDISQEIKAQDESRRVTDSLKPIFDRLTDIRRELEGLALTHRWSLRETDLWNYTLSLQEIDKMRVDGKFVDLEKNAPQGQYVSIFG